MRTTELGLCTVALVTLVAADAAGEEKERTLGELDVARVRELHHLTDTLGDRLWPGFDARKIPIAVNCGDRQELLVGHPKPPAEFKPFGDHELAGRPVMIREGCTRYGPKGGGWAVDLGGEHSAYVGTVPPGGTTESWLSLLIHECFHVYQRRYRPRAEGAGGELPEDDPVYAALIGLESRVLHAALNEADDEKAQDLARMFVAVRRERRKDLPRRVVILEGEEEYSEGTATYIQARLMQLLAEAPDFRPAQPGADPQYDGFRIAPRELRQLIAGILPSTTRPISFHHAQYRVGMAQCLLLDRFRADWKTEIRAAGTTQTALVERQFPVKEDEVASLLGRARTRFDYDDLASAQRRIVEERLAKIRGFLDAEGRRYRVFHAAIEGSFNWKPRGPVYRVPRSLTKPPMSGTTVWAGGMVFKRGDLEFVTQDVPVLFRYDYLEWIDRDPAADDSDLVIESESREGDVYVGLRLTTDGFVLKIGRARVEQGPEVVSIHPLR